MFNTNTISAKIKIHNPYAVNYVLEWFGKDTYISKEKDEIFATVRANETSLIYWCLQYGESVELVAPKSTRKEINEIVEEMWKRYK